jgi:hypothetical protein
MDNGIPIIDYCNDNKNDVELVQLSQFLKEKVLPASDVRVPLSKKFQLKRYQDFSKIHNLQSFLT